MQDNNILLIGGTGTLSQAVMRHAVKAGYNVYVLNRGNHNDVLLPTVVPLKANFYKADSVRKAIDGCSFDVVVDFLSRKPQDLERIFPLFVNAKQYVFVSTACVYRRDPDDGIITENSPKPNRNWSYNMEKWACEQKLEKLAHDNGSKYTIVRPYITYDNKRIPFGLAPTFYDTHWTIIARIMADKPLFLWDDGLAKCTLTHVDDFAVGVVGLFNNPKAYNEDFHITTDNSQSWLDMLLLLYSILKKKPNIVKIPTDFICETLPEYRGMLLGDRSLNAEFDITKIKDAVPDFKPIVSLQAGLMNLIEYYRTHNYLNGIDYVWDGKIDRLITSYVERDERLRYQDYLHEKKVKNHVMYWKGRYVWIMRISCGLRYLRRKLWERR